jgi:hypothetical protein
MEMTSSFEETIKNIDDVLALVKLPQKKRRTKKARQLTPKTYSGKGYSYTYVNGKPVLEHRVIMEKKLGRKLLPHEAVFFKNGKKRDLRPSNLILGLKQGIPLSTVTCPHCEQKYVED